MKDRLITLFVMTLFLFGNSDFTFSQNDTGVDRLDLEQDGTYSAHDSVLIMNSTQNVTIDNAAGFIQINHPGGCVEINGNPTSENDNSLVSFKLSNKGVNGDKHSWRMHTSSFAGEWGVRSNGYEIWEYPAGTSDSKRRFVIQTSRNISNYSSVVIGPRGGVSIGFLPYFAATDINDLSVNGNVGIGTLDTKGHKLAVNGTIIAKEIKVESSDWADFVFKKGYKLPTIEEVKRHIDEKGALPGVPTEKEIKTNGVNLAETDVLLLQKIEELTLYIIDLKQEIDELKMQIKK